MSTLSRATGTVKERRKNDFYATVDVRVVVPLVPLLDPDALYLEPCAGAGDLIGLLADQGLSCHGRFDIAPQCPFIPRHDALSLRPGDADLIITNPPWRRDMLHPLISHFVAVARETWLLFDAAWPQTKAAAPIGRAYCTDVVAVGRVKWFLNSANDATDDCAWYRFARSKDAPTRYHWRAGQVDAVQGVLV